MKRGKSRRALPVSEQAAEWLVALDDGDLDTRGRAAFLTWLRQSPEHIREFLQLSAMHVELARNPELESDIETLVAAARADVVELEPHQNARHALPATRRRGRWLQAAAVLVVGIVAASGSWLLDRPAVDTVYQTALGEQRSIGLDDGSVIVLNTLSRIHVDYQSDRRAVQLVSGEALFDVAKDSARPFVVDAGAMQLRVLGTRFNVYRQTDETVLTVVEGEVAVSTSGGAIADVRAGEPALTALAGDQVAVENESGALSATVVSTVAPSTAWTERKLVFQAVSLADVAEEFNRYNRRPLRIEDAVLADRPITGVFNAHDADLLAAFLANQPGIVVERRADGIYVRSAAVDGANR